MSRLLLAAVIALCPLQPRAGEPLLVFAAASLKNALDEVVVLYRSESNLQPVVSYGASSTLAKQIENGAPADLFLSADLDWMDYVEKKGLLAEGTRRNLLGNRLVLIAPTAHPIRLQPAPGFEISRFLGNSRIALADPNSVPAGKYAKAALEKLGAWEQVSGHVAAAENVRAALALVARGEAPLGVVYETDAREEPRVVVAGVFPAGSHPPIVYPVAALKGAKSGTANLLDFLEGPQARRIFGKHGFAVN